MAVEVAIAVCTKIAEYTVKPILNPIIRPFKYLWEYRSNLESLSIKMQELETKVSEVQGFTIEGANRLQELQDWHDKVSRISNEVEAIPDPEIEPESMTCGQRLSYSTLKQSYLRRKDVARALEKIARLNKEATRSENEWKDKSNFHNLMKAMENLEAVRDERKSSIKEGEEALPDAKKWLGKVDDLIVEISNTIRSQPPTRQCCKRFTCLKCYDRRQNVDCKLNEVGRLLEEGRRFEEFSCPAEETKYKRSLDDLKKEVEKLKVEKHSEELSGKDGNLTVHLWRNNVDKINDKVSHLDEDYSPERIEEVVRLRKEVVELFEEAKGLTKAKELKDLSIQLNSEEPWSQSIKSLPPLESRISILEEIMVKLQEPDVSIVGIWGLGGIGKTTLAKQVAIQAMEDGIFDKYVFVEVSASPDVKNIQEEIGCKLAFSFQHKDHIPGRARELHQRLKNAEKTLLVFDNIWEGLNFERLGIPCKDNQKGLKLLMTGRDQNVLNDGVEPLSSYNFRIETLEWEDAWSLFRSKANVPQDHFLAIEVARECGGVPIAIVTLGSALSNKEDYVWRDTLRELREPSADSFDGIAGPVYQSIALSYNHLKSDKLKETFLLCSSMPNTNDSSVEDLWRYGVSLGLFSSCKTLEEERDNVLTLLSILKSSSLLVDAPDHDRIFLPYRERFAMHDVVCDVARSIAQKKGNCTSY